MFPTSFSFAAALFALPLAGAPILLHLLYRQKSPVVMFSTLRFIKLSVKQTAARRKVQKWLLLACRALLIALLIWAIAQPVRQLSSSWSGGTGRSLVAAVVIDDSYSTQLKDGQATILAKEESIVQELLRDQLAGGKVAIFTSRANPNSAEQLKDPSALLAGWRPMTPQARSKPLADRVASAVNLLGRETADSKWLVVLSDFQSSEFPSPPIPELPGGRTILFDLHPAEARSAGVTAVSISPAQPVPGVESTATVQVTGHAGDSPLVHLELGGVGAAPASTPDKQLHLDAGGKATATFSIKMPADQRWLQLTGVLAAPDDMTWDDRRSLLVEVPLKQSVGVMWTDAPPAVKKFVGSALDPFAGDAGQKDWPLAVHAEAAVAGGDDAVVATLTRWPSAAQAAALQSFAASGHDVVLFLTPGLEAAWPAIPPVEQKSLLDLLPSAPVSRSAVGPWHVAVTSAPELGDLADDKFQMSSIVVRQMLTMSATGSATAVLNAVESDPTSTARPQGLLFRKPVGRGVCYTFATMPDGRATNFGAHPTFLPLLVKMVLPNPGQTTAQNVELGQPLALPAAKFPGVDKLQIVTPAGGTYDVNLSKDKSVFPFAEETVTGVYVWKNGNDTVAMTSVQPPAAESDLIYTPASAVAAPGPNTVIASSIAELNGKVKELATPQPQWSTPLAIVLFLLCVEALMGSWTGLWKRRAPAVEAARPA